jgi:L-alanine-DL-glutamate epimerase-like enolase superfamily enzyme
LELHRAVTEPLRKKLSGGGMAPLAAGFGPALLEAACVDAACRRAGQSFSAALKNGLLGLSAEDAARLPAPLPFVRLRHTVGLADALDASDLQNPLADGLPETLEEVVAAYRPAFFKVKISGDASESLERLRRIAVILDARAGDYAVTLDGNEQFQDMDTFAAFLAGLREQPALNAFLKRALWIEQPVLRDAALNPESGAALRRVAAFKPVIIDESDGEGDALERALALGYAGVSSKTCKGLFRSISHFLRLPAGGILSSEDLTTVPVLPLQQDLCLAAALGLSHSERNGHHYIRGFDFLTSAERNRALAAAPSLYAEEGGGNAKVRIADGGFHLQEINAAPGFGSAFTPDWEALQPLDPQR